MPPLSIMVKPASALCNLRCEYCFYKDVAQNREQSQYALMMRETAAALIKNPFHLQTAHPYHLHFRAVSQLLQELIITEILLPT